MIDFLKTVFNWIKMNFAKEAILTTISLVFAVLISYIIHSILWEENGNLFNDKPLDEYGINYLEYRVFLFLIILAMIYGIRFVERMLKIVLIKPELKE